MALKLKRLDSAREITGVSRSGIYAGMKKGVFPPSIKLAGRTCAWLEHELEALNAARMAGKSEAEIEEVILELVAKRPVKYVTLMRNMGTTE